MFQLHVSEYLRMEGYCKQIEIYFPHFIAINFTVIMFNPLINYFWTSMDSLGVTWHAFADAFVWRCQHNENSYTISTGFYKCDSLRYYTNPGVNDLIPSTYIALYSTWNRPFCLTTGKLSMFKVSSAFLC